MTLTGFLRFNFSNVKEKIVKFSRSFAVKKAKDQQQIEFKTG